MIAELASGGCLFDCQSSDGWVPFSLSKTGFVIAGLGPTARVAQVVGMVIFYPTLLLSGAGLPSEMLPEAIRSFSKFLPLTHVVTLLEGLWFGATGQK